MALPGVVLKILKVDNGMAGKNPTATFQVTDKSGNAVDITELTTIRMVLGGSNVGYGTGPGGLRVSETPTKATGGTNGIYMYTMTNAIPAATTGSYTISIGSGEHGNSARRNHATNDCN
ncbi:MAG: hypothetical protein ABSB35_29355 [Bryobacteraceae bacterium]